MKNWSLLLLSLLSLISSTSSAYSDINDIVLVNNIADLYEKNYSPIGFKLTFKIGRRAYTKGLTRGHFSWSKIHIKSNQIRVERGWLQVDREALINNHNTIEMEVQVTLGGKTFTKVIKYTLPEIKKISYPSQKLVPYTKYPKIIHIITTKKSYIVKPTSKLAGLKYKDFEWLFAQNYQIKNNFDYFSYYPSIDSKLTEVHLTILNKKYSIRDTFKLKIQPLEELTIDYKGLSGETGQTGNCGMNGDLGQDGEDGDDGSTGGYGKSGPSIDLIISDKYPIHFELILFVNHKVFTYTLPKNCKVTISSIGGDGGQGGSGGSGGNGGQADENRKCGTDGMDGSKGEGGPGGPGGTIKVFSDLNIRALANILELDVSGGLGGNGSYNGVLGTKGNLEYLIISTSNLEKLVMGR